MTPFGHMPWSQLVAMGDGTGGAGMRLTRWQVTWALAVFGAMELLIVWGVIWL